LFTKMYLLIKYVVLNRNVHSHITRGTNDLHVTVVNKNYGNFFKYQTGLKQPSFEMDYLNIFKKVSSIKNVLKKLNHFCCQQAPIVRISMFFFANVPPSHRIL